MRHVALAVPLLLLGCASPAQNAAQREYDHQQYLGRVHQRCLAYGFEVGSPAFSDCMMRVDQQNRANAGAAAAAILGSGAYRQPPIQTQQPYQMPRQRTTNCYSDALGNTRCTHQ